MGVFEASGCLLPLFCRLLAALVAQPCQALSGQEPQHIATSPESIRIINRLVHFDVPKSNL